LTEGDVVARKLFGLALVALALGVAAAPAAAAKSESYQFDFDFSDTIDCSAFNEAWTFHGNFEDL
jgi:hypothetical protein